MRADLDFVVAVSRAEIVVAGLSRAVLKCQMVHVEEAVVRLLFNRLDVRHLFLPA